MKVDAAMIRVLSTFIYFTGIKWLRPALLIPADGEPVLFVAKGEEEGLKNLTWIKNVQTYAEGGELMGKVSGLIRQKGYKAVGLEFTLERDSYILFYEMFKRLNRAVKVVDISPVIHSMRMIKDKYELNAIRKAGKISSEAMRTALEVVSPGKSETEIAGEIYAFLYKLGSQEPLVYVNAGPYPRIHGEPLPNLKVVRNSFVTIVISADYGRYYANISRSIYVGEPKGLASKAIECIEETYRTAVEQTKIDVKFSHVMSKLDEVYNKYGLIDKRVLGYVHGVGLQVEETPITTIVPKDRFMEPLPGMALAMVHAPLLIEGLGQVKKEDTFIVRQDGSLEKVTGI